ncbi:MAG: T9SS type A sorting domain-containing protein [Ignavibacteriales bacterium]|nr:T9SS type A sorting domain-containing protein [Ignavibacteriales bacterium]
MLRFKYLLFLFLFFAFESSVFAQMIRPKLTREKPSIVQQQSVKILTVRVEFQPDKDGVTVGDGTFSSIYTKDWGKRILDPLPHDAVYFENHLLFAKNYFAKVSGGQFNVDYTVIPVVITLNKTMKNYSPPINSNDFSPIAEMMQEVWAKVDSAMPNLDFTQFNLFTIFHAGVGRDVTLPGSLGNERDIPSVYMGMNTLKKVYGATFTGIPVRNNSFLIKNSIILPQTQSREGESFGTKYLIKLTFNGLLVSNIASHLGLPDLFNTKTGISAIGLFGLMDGQSIFAFNGTFPSQPSAWEKMQLGWVSPVTVKQNNLQTLSVKTSLMANSLDTTIIKVPLNEEEHYLIENRQRDANKDGAKVVVFTGTGYDTLKFAKDTTGFYSFAADSLYGVIVDVDEYDWAVPGSGLVIWHVDNNVIRDKWESNLINADKEHRGLEVEEADGIKDIGNQFTNVLGDVITGEGSEEDLWRSGNTGQFYTNVFSNTTRPNTNTNSGANSFITFSEFSASANTMTVKLSYGLGNVKPVFSTKLPKPIGKTFLSTDQNLGKQSFFVQNGNDVLILDSAGNIIKSLLNFSQTPVAVTSGWIFGTTDSTFETYDNIFRGSAIHANKITTPVSLHPMNGDIQAVFGNNNGTVYFSNFHSLIGDSSTSIGTIPVTHISAMQNAVVAVLQDTINKVFTFISPNRTSFSLNNKVTDLKTFSDANGKIYSVVSTEDNSFHLFAGNEKIRAFAVNTKVQSFSLLDIKQDGTPYILFTSADKLYAYNILGVIADYFPFAIGNVDNSSEHAVQAYYNNTLKEYFLMINTTTGVQLFNARNGKQVDGFPAGLTSASSDIVLLNYNDKLSLGIYDSTGTVTVWQLSDISGTIALTGLGNAANSNSSVFVSPNKTGIGFLTPEKTYNYPNPVRSGVTYFRFDVNEDAQVTIKIFDLSGDYAAELKGEGRGGFDNEIPWNVTHIQSGIYLAHIEAVGVSGKKAHKIIKVSVVK